LWAIFVQKVWKLTVTWVVIFTLCIVAPQEGKAHKLLAALHGFRLQSAGDDAGLLERIGASNVRKAELPMGVMAPAVLPYLAD
jgi:hypothetical protein